MHLYLSKWLLDTITGEIVRSHDEFLNSLEFKGSRCSFHAEYSHFSIVQSGSPLVVTSTLAFKWFHCHSISYIQTVLLHTSRIDI